MNQQPGSFSRRFGLALLLTGVGIASAGAQTMDFGRCVPIEDVSARLACYDRAAGRQSTPAPAAAAQRPAPAAAPAVTAPAVPAPAPAAAPAADPVAGFGAPSGGLRNDPLTAARTEKAIEQRRVTPM